MNILGRIIIASLICLAVLFIVIVISTVIWWEEQKLEEKRKEIEEKHRKEKERFEQQCITMCLRTRQANACLGVCKKCAWGRRNIELRGRR